MDISTTLNKSKRSKAAVIKWTALSLLFASLFAFSYMPFHQAPALQLADLILSEVKRGDLDVTVSGYGQLKAQHQQFLTSQFQATVAEIAHYPGQEVNKDTIVMTLANPQLKSQVADAELAVAQQQARLDELKIEQQSAQLERKSVLTLLESDLENARLRVEAETILARDGIVSALDFKRSQLLVAQLEKRLQIEHQRFAQLQLIQQQRQTIQNDLLKQYQVRLDNAEQQVASLNVKAGLDGVLQTLEVEVGQTVAAGSVLGLVGSNKKLKAQLRIQQREAETVSLGMQGLINTFGGEAHGTVTRIDPIIVDGRVMVELELSGQLPRNARPDLTVDGKIFTGTVANAMYVTAPIQAVGHRTGKLYKLSNNNKHANQIQVEFGRIAGDRIEIKQGLNIGDQVIISDLSHLYENLSLDISE